MKISSKIGIKYKTVFDIVDKYIKSGKYWNKNHTRIAKNKKLFQNHLDFMSKRLDDPKFSNETVDKIRHEL